MLIRLLRAYLAPYRRPIAGLLVLSLAGTMAALLLPSLHAGAGRLFHLGDLPRCQDRDELWP
jgi:hypothetical protein